MVAGGVSMCLMAAKVGELPYRAGQSKERAKLTRFLTLTESEHSVALVCASRSITPVLCLVKSVPC